MKTPSFFQGVCVAFALALLALGVFSAFSWFVSIDELLKLTLAVVGGSYVAYLLRASPEKTGRLAISALWVISVIGVGIFVQRLGGYFVAHLLMIWLVRSLYFYPGVLLAIVDMALTALSAIAAVATLTHTHNIFLSIWTFFLGQALFVAIPSIIKTRCHAGIDNPNRRFQGAYRSAQSAIRRIHSNAN